jgi:poly(A) polymerase/tRNA nucleotidyltransferase (CCA-adding enzyme)
MLASQYIQSEQIPKDIRAVALTLEIAGFEAYLVGGCVRDMIMNKTPKDYDLTTSAKPEEIIALFPKTFYENEFGTVGVVVNHELETEQIVEVTPFRTESMYSDNRHPDVVSFSNNIADDLCRRDFTMNAVAYRVSTNELIDLHEGIGDILSQTIRTVGNPNERFGEDALRLLRAVRFSAQLGFHVEQSAKAAITELAYKLQDISKERIRDEFVRIIESDQPMAGLILAHELGLLQYIVPELENGIGVTQNQAHSYDVWEHNLRTLQHAADMKWPLHVRLSAIFHDISKPETRRFSAEKKQYTFYGHDVVGGRVTREIMKRLKFSKELTDQVSLFVRWHMFFSDTEEISLSAVRRLIAHVGKQNVWDLMDLRVCDRIGTGRPKAEPYRLRKYKAMVEQAMRDPVTVGMLQIDGARIMEVTHETPGPKIGYVLHALLEEVLEDPSKNTSEYLEKQAVLHMKRDLVELKALSDQGKQKKEEVEGYELKEIHKKFKI